MSDTLERATEGRNADVEAPLQQLKQMIEAEPATRSRGGFTAGLSLLLVIALGSVVGAAGYWLWPQWQALQQQSSQLAQNQQRLSEQSRQLQDHSQQMQQQLQTEQQQRLTQLEQRLEQQQQQLMAQTQAQVQAVRQLVQQRDSAPPRHWLLAEVEYLVKLAAQKVWLEQDMATAVALLQSADDKLALLDDASLLPVRQAIAADQQQLAIGWPDDENCKRQRRHAGCHHFHHVSPHRDQLEAGDPQRVIAIGSKRDADEGADQDDLMQRIDNDLRGLSRERHPVTVTIDSQDKRCEIAVVETEWLSAMGNLVSNAVRYTPDGQPIEVRWQMLRDGRAEFSVKDGGVGIAPEHIPRLSERFYRADSSRSRNTGGTGLGLSIVKHVVQRHGGELKVVSELGRGSTFSLTLPAVRVRLV